MSYSEHLADRVARCFLEKQTLYEEKKMMGGQNRFEAGGLHRNGFYGKAHEGVYLCSAGRNRYG